MTVFQIILLSFLVLCAIAVSFSKNLVNAVLIFMSYSLVMSIMWICLESPDLAITEAAVGAGITTVLFVVTLRKLRIISADNNKGNEELNDIDTSLVLENDERKSFNATKEALNVLTGSPSSLDEIAVEREGRDNE